jgi:signal peptidase II
MDAHRPSTDPAMPASGLRRWLVGPFTGPGLWTALLTFAIDQSHKWWMLLIYRIEEKARLAEGGRVRVTPFMDLVFVINQGVSYGMFQQGHMGGQIMLAAFAALVSLALVVWLARGVDSRLLALSVGLIIGGALGNALDRLLIGGVADFFSLHAFGYYWYVFNIADVAIVAGVLGLLYDSFVVSRSAAKSP